MDPVLSPRVTEISEVERVTLGVDIDWIACVLSTEG